jgi:hypothetical protein
MRGGIGLPLLERFLPVGVLLPEPPDMLRVVRLQARIERFHQHRQAQERA